MRMGLPRILTSDQGGEFRNEIDKNIMKLLGIKHHFITPYHPQVPIIYMIQLPYNCLGKRLR